MKLKVLVIGNQNANRRVASSLAESQIEVVCKSDATEAINLLKQEKFDLALVDAYLDNLESTCYRISWLTRTTVALILKGVENEWDKLHNLDVDGFIPEEARNMELVEYFQTICRRSANKFERIKILIVEDDEQIRETLKLAFNIYWPEAVVSFAANGQQGVRMAHADPVDTILLDLRLPDISGLEVLNQIRAFSQTPVIILTADRNPENIIKAVRSGANDYILKPFRQVELISRIRQCNHQKVRSVKL
jgi:DNA-binding response OmpR family regulator